MRKSTTLALTALLAPSWTAARAGPVTWVFTGEVTLVDDPNGVFDSAVEVGSPLSAQVTFDPATPGLGVYENAILDVLGTAGDTPFSGPTAVSNTIYIANNVPYDAMTLNVGVSLGSTNEFFNILLRDSSGSVFDANGLPLEPPALGDLDPTGALFSLGSKDETFVVQGRLTGLALIPEPSTVVLFFLGGLCLALTRRRRPSASAASRVPTRFSETNSVAMFVGATAVGLISPRAALSQNCPLSQQCGHIDLVVLIDTSGSTQNEVEQTCTAIKGVSGADGVLYELRSRGYEVSDEILKIGSADSVQMCQCCIAATTVATRYGVSIPGLPEALDDPAPPIGNDCPYSTEDWGPASAIVAYRKAQCISPFRWTPWALRILVPVVDEGARCGDEINSDDTDAIAHAIPFMAANNVVVLPIVAPNPSGSTPLVTAQAQALADGGAPGGMVFSSEDPELVQHMVDHIISLCTPLDCNQNGIADAATGSTSWTWWYMPTR